MTYRLDGLGPVSAGLKRRGFRCVSELTFELARIYFASSGMLAALVPSWIR